MKPASVILLLPAIIYMAITIIWQQQGVNQITGDEPHYLLTTDSLLRDGDLQVVNNHQIDTPVLRCMPPGSSFGDDTHAVNGYSIHGLGLPLLLLPAYALGGVLGAKIWMAALLGLTPVVIYRQAQERLPGTRWPLPIALIVALSPPFLIGSNQLYPDLLAGLIIFGLLFDTPSPVAEGHGRGGWGVRAILLALLPWLHLKFLLPALILAGVGGVRGRQDTRATRSFVALGCAIGPHPPAPSPASGRGGAGSHWSAESCLLPPASCAAPLLVSVVGLGIYNQIAFGSPFGPYRAGDAATDLGGVAMVALGLHLDRMQGLFFQAPLFLLGVFGLALFAAEQRRLALAAGAIYLAVLLPSAAHTNWYGGASFAGRFFWAVVLLWCFPLLATIRHLHRRRMAPLAVALLAVAITLEGIFVSKVLIPNTYTYTGRMHPTATWMDSNPYADFFDLTAIQRARWLPSFRDVDSFVSAPANWIGLGLLVCLAASGLCLAHGWRRAALVTWGLFAVGAVGLAWAVPPPIRPALLTSELELRRGAGYLAAGPRDVIQPGLYAVTLDYAAASAPGWDCALVGADGGREVLAAGDLPAGAASRRLRLACAIPRASDRSTIFEVRLYASGGALSLRHLAIQPLDER